MEEALAVAETIRSSVSKTPMSNNGLSVTVSIGVATLPDHAAEPQELLKAADQAMYAAKQSGRNCVRCAGESGGAVLTPAVQPTRSDEQITNLLASVDLTPRLEQANGRHIEIGIENRSDVEVQVTKIGLMYKEVRAAEDKVETSERGRLSRRGKKMIQWVDTPGLAQAMQEIRGEFNREFDDFVDIRIQIEALGRLRDLPPHRVKVKVEPGGSRVWQIR